MRQNLTLWVYRQQARYRYRQSLTQSRQGNVDAVLKTLPLALAHHPRPADIRIELGKACWQSGAMEAALAHFTEAIALDPTSVRAYGNRGRSTASRAAMTWPSLTGRQGSSTSLATR
jgi:Flp pilus assembly protein TadD